MVGWVLALARELLAWLWRRRESAREARESMRRTARLVADDWPLLSGSSPASWQAESGRETLVTALPKREWDAVTRAYGVLDEINGMTAYRDEVDNPRLKKAADQALAPVREAIQALDRASS